jgi:hypothetical protein
MAYAKDCERESKQLQALPAYLSGHVEDVCNGEIEANASTSLEGRTNPACHE